MAEAEAATVGFVGLGNMGVPMTRRLLDAGFRVVGFDASPTAAERLTGAEGFSAAGDLVDVARGGDVVILMLPSSDVVEQVLVDQQLLAALRPGTLLVDMGSSEPARTRQMAARAEASGVTMLDAPVSGGVRGAETGQLTIMVGGPAPAIERVRPLLEAMGSRIVHVGEVGAGDAVKALNNLMSATHILVSSEAILAARRFGLDPAIVVEIINGSSGKSGATESKWPRFILPGTYDSGFRIELMVKDMRIALALAHEVGAPASLSELSTQLWVRAAEDLPPDADHTEIARWLEASAG